MDRFQALSAFTAVVDAGSYAGAAQRLDLSVSASSRQVAELESHLGARLLNRTTRRLSLNETGRAFREHAVQLRSELAEAEAQVRAHTAVPRGTLKLTSSNGVCASYLAPAIAELQRLYAELRLDVELSDRVI